MTPDDTKQLAEDVAKVMELERAWRAAPYDEPSYSNFMNATPAMADIIRQLLQVVEMQRDVLEKLKAQELGDYIYDIRSRAAESGDGFEGSSWEHPDVLAFSEAIDGIDAALALITPLIKENL